MKIVAAVLVALVASLAAFSCYTPIYDAKLSLGLKNSSNNNQLNTVATPLISPAAGNYDIAQSIILSCSTPQAEIHYTTDGRVPDSYSSLYTPGVQIITPGQTVMIKAIATKTGMYGSAVSEATVHVRSWQIVGSPNLTGGGTATPSLALSPDGTPFVGLVDGNMGNEPSVLYLNGVDWSFLGSRPLALTAMWGPSIAIDSSSQYYMSFRESTSTKVSVYCFTSNWASLGAPSFSVPMLLATTTTLAINSSNIPYVGFQDDPSGKANVMKFLDPSWILVGGVPASPGAANFLSLSLDPVGTAYIAFQDGSSGLAATVMKFDGAAWVYVGSPGFSGGWANYTSLVIDSSGAPYIGFEDSVYVAKVMKFDGSSWVDYGNAGSISGNSVDRTSLAVSRATATMDRLYLAYTRQSGPGVYSVSVMQFNGSMWEVIGGRDFYTDSIFPDVIQVAISPNDGTPYISIHNPVSNATSVLRLQ